jgi:uncharacterized protein (DUF302 family)
MPKALATLLLLLVLATALPAAADSGLVSRASRHSVAETIDRLEATLKQDKYQVFARIDFQVLAAAHGAQVRPSQILLFGRGGLLPSLLPAAPVAAVDLPLKILAWEDGDGKVWVTYNTGEYLKQRHAIAGIDEPLKRLTGALKSFADRAAE